MHDLSSLEYLCAEFNDGRELVSIYDEPDRCHRIWSGDTLIPVPVLSPTTHSPAALTPHFRRLARVEQLCLVTATSLEPYPRQAPQYSSLARFHLLPVSSFICLRRPVSLRPLRHLQRLSHGRPRWWWRSKSPSPSHQLHLPAPTTALDRADMAVRAARHQD